MFKYIGILIVVSIITFAFLLTSTTKTFHLEIINQSEKAVNHVRLSGSAVVNASTSESIPVGERSYLDVEVKDSGSIRFEVKHGMDEVDLAIYKDITVEPLQDKLLTIKKDGHYLISDPE